MPGSTPFHVPPNVLHGCDSSFVGRQFRSTPGISAPAASAPHDVVPRKRVLVAAEALEQSVLESKDKDQLLAIAKALGLKASARTKKSDIIDQILETTGSARGANGDLAVAAVHGSANGDAPAAVDVVAPDASDHRHAAGADAGPRRTGRGGSTIDEPPAEWELAVEDDSGGRRCHRCRQRRPRRARRRPTTATGACRGSNPPGQWSLGRAQRRWGPAAGVGPAGIGAAARGRREPQPPPSPPPQGRRAGPRWPAG